MDTKTLHFLIKTQKEMRGEIPVTDTKDKLVLDAALRGALLGKPVKLILTEIMITYSPTFLQ